jgi:hypothetical protein
MYLFKCNKSYQAKIQRSTNNSNYGNYSEYTCSSRSYTEKKQRQTNKSNYNYSGYIYSSLVKVTKQKYNGQLTTVTTVTTVIIPVQVEVTQKKKQRPTNKSNYDNYSGYIYSSLVKVTKQKYNGQLTKVTATTTVNIPVQA